MRARGICHLGDSTRLIYRESSAIGNKPSTCCVRQAGLNHWGQRAKYEKYSGSRLFRRGTGRVLPGYDKRRNLDELANRREPSLPLVAVRGYVVLRQG